MFNFRVKSIEMCEERTKLFNVTSSDVHVPVAAFIHTWGIVKEIFNPLSVSLGASLESRCCRLILNSSV
jgi:hypothetical protein